MKLSDDDFNKLQKAFQSAFEEYFKNATQEDIYNDFGPGKWE